MMRAMLLAVALGTAGCNLVWKAVAKDRSPCVDQRDLVLCLDFQDEIDDGIATDRSPSGADALVGPNATKIMRGVDNEAVHLDPQGPPIEVPDNDRIDGLNQFTFELTVQFDGQVDVAPPTLLEHKWGYALTMSGDGRAVCSLSDGAIIMSNTERLDDGRAHRITCVVSEQLAMFVDGLAQNSSTPTTPVGPTKQSTLIGNGLAGMVDTVRIWSRALSSTEVDETREDVFED